jgi:hypothetical protein
MAEHGMGINDIAIVTHLSEQEVGSIFKEGNG